MDGIIRHTYSRLTLYDLLAMLLPGILFVGEILYLLDIPLENKISVSLIVLLAYPAGLVLHSLSEYVWNGGCKSKSKDKCEKKVPKCEDNNKEDCKQTDTDKKKCKKQIDTLKQWFCKCKNKWYLYKLYGFRNNPEQIREELQVTLQYAPSGNVHKLTQDLVKEDNQLLDKYNEAYYYVVDVKQHGNTIRTLEGQIAMMRSLIIPFVLLVVVAIKYFCCNAIDYICCCTGQDISHWVIAIIAFLPIVVTLIVFCCSAVCKQKAIYHRVWEDYEYLRRMESNYEKTK